MQVLVCDDEALARLRLVRWLEALDTVQQVYEASNGAEALAICKDKAVDVALLDIRMPTMDGLETAAAIKEHQLPTKVIFCTAYDDHALEAFRVQAVDYVLKPVSRDDLLEALQRVRPEEVPECISARTHKGVEVVPVQEVRCFVAEHKYVTAYHSKGSLLLDESLVELEKRFAERVVRVHRSALVAKAYIAALEVGEQGAFLRLRGVDVTVPVSRRLLPKVRQLVAQL